MVLVPDSGFVQHGCHHPHELANFHFRTTSGVLYELLLVITQNLFPPFPWTCYQYYTYFSIQSEQFDLCFNGIFCIHATVATLVKWPPLLTVPLVGCMWIDGYSRILVF